MLNPQQKINGKLVRTIERKFYKEELLQIIEKQKEFIPELTDSELYNKCIEKLYPNNAIKYGILCGYNDCPQYYYWKYFTLHGNYINETVPLFVDGTGSPYALHFMYWQSLVALAEKTSLTESEQMLKVSCIKYCDEVEDDALAEYWGQVFVEIDGEKYIVKEYGKKRQ